MSGSDAESSDGRRSPSISSEEEEEEEEQDQQDAHSITSASSEATSSSLPSTTPAGKGSNPALRTPSPMPELSGGDAEDLRRVFDAVDTDGSGYLDREEISALAKRMGKRLRRKQLDKLMAEIDPDGDEQVTFDEFAQWWRANAPSGGGLFGGFLKKLWPGRTRSSSSTTSLGTEGRVTAARAGGGRVPPPTRGGPERLAWQTAAGACQWAELGCGWDGPPELAKEHQRTCEYRILSKAELQIGALDKDSSTLHRCPFAGVGCQAVFASHRPLAAHAAAAAHEHLELLAAALDRAQAEKDDLRAQCEAQGRAVAAVKKRVATVVGRVAASSQGGIGSGERSEWDQLRRRLDRAEADGKKTSEEAAQAAARARADVASVQSEVRETLRGLSHALEKQRCAICNAVFSEGANTSHSCVFHPGVRGANGRWSCCKRPCAAMAAGVGGSGRGRGVGAVASKADPDAGRMVDGCICDFHRARRSDTGQAATVPWAIMPQPLLGGGVMAKAAAAATAQSRAAATIVSAPGRRKAARRGAGKGKGARPRVLRPLAP
jgi:hypothetical protein